jgi:hypothetical protein
MKVLMGIDDSKFAAEIARAFVAQFRAENTDVLVLHVLQPLGLSAPPEMAAGYAPELADLKQLAHELVDRIAGQLRAAGFKAETAVEVGDVRERILDSASCWEAWPSSSPATPNAPSRSSAPRQGTDPPMRGNRGDSSKAPDSDPHRFDRSDRKARST